MQLPGSDREQRQDMARARARTSIVLGLSRDAQFTAGLPGGKEGGGQAARPQVIQEPTHPTGPSGRP